MDVYYFDHSEHSLLLKVGENMLAGVAIRFIRPTMADRVTSPIIALLPALTFTATPVTNSTLAMPREAMVVRLAARQQLAPTAEMVAVRAMLVEDLMEAEESPVLHPMEATAAVAVDFMAMVVAVVADNNHHNNHKCRRAFRTSVNH